MIVSRIENGISYVQLNLGERNLNTEIRALLSKVSSSSSSPAVRKRNLNYQINMYSLNR